MISEEEIQRYLPKYLSPESYSEIISELKDFPDNLDKRMYSLLNENVIYQGDIIKDFPIIDLRHLENGTKYRDVIVLSNTCDIYDGNSRLNQNNIVYAPLIQLERYISYLQQCGEKGDIIQNHINSIKKQRNSSILYLPASGIISDSIVFLDSVLSISTSFLNGKQISGIRIHSLSNYGFYLLLFKLSVHFCRMQEKVDRKPVFSD